MELRASAQHAAGFAVLFPSCIHHDETTRAAVELCLSMGLPSVCGNQGNCIHLRNSVVLVFGTSMGRQLRSR